MLGGVSGTESSVSFMERVAIAMLRGVIPVMLDCPECGWPTATASTTSMDDNMIKYWYPVLFGFYDIIMNGEDLEVRRLQV